MDRVTVTYENHIAFVRLTRADKMNAVDQAMIDAIIAAGQEVAASDARVAVLSGEGRAFCAGIDISGLASRPTLAAQAGNESRPDAPSELSCLTLQQFRWEGWRYGKPCICPCN